MKNTENKINIPIAGMDRDSHPSRVKENTFTFANNITFEDSSGNGFPLVQNEPSNLLCQDFKNAFIKLGGFASYYIVGYRYNPSLNRTYLFLTNEDLNNEFYGTSIIGYLSNSLEGFNSIDEDASCECINLKILDKPLENQEQVPLCDFKIIAEDSCSRVDGGKGCLNFSIDNPIFEKNIRFKNEQCGRRIYWTDRHNPPRYLDLDLIESTNREDNFYFYDNYIASGEELSESELPCLDCEKLKMIPDYSIPCILPNSIQLGGGLRLGTYEFLIAYCDEEGNELSSYFSHTNPVNLFDYSNIHLKETELDKTTGYAIELKVSNLDEDFQFYKVAVIQHTSVNGEESYFFEGVHPISDKTVLYTSDRNKKTTTINHILARKIKVESVEQMIDSNGYLFMAGIKNKPVLNLQPVVNLMGPYFKWSTTIAKEDFYKDGINASNYRSYMRDEVYPLSISFGTTDGTETNDFILINRGPQRFKVSPTVSIGDMDWVNKYDLNYTSFLDTTNDCTTSVRKHRWQFENTAQLKGVSDLTPRCLTLEDKEDYLNKLKGEGTFSKKSEKSCSIYDMVKNGVALNTSSNFQLKIGGDYRKKISYLDYVNKHVDKYTDENSSLYSSRIKNLLDKSRYSTFDCSTTSACNCLDDNKPLREVVELYELELSSPNITYKTAIKLTELPYVEAQFPGGIREEDYRLTSKYLKREFGSIHLRPNREVGNTCNSAVDLKSLQDIVVEETDGFIIPVVGTKMEDSTYDSLLFNKYNSTSTTRFNYPINLTFINGDQITRADGTKCRKAAEEWHLLRGEIFFPNKVCKNALWTQTKDITEDPYIQISTKSTTIIETPQEVSLDSAGALSKDNDVAYNKLKKIRVSIFNKMCAEEGTVVTPLKVLFLDSEKSHLLNLKSILGVESGEFKIAIDTPIINLLQYEINFVRWYDKRSVGYTNGAISVPDKYKLFTKTMTYAPTLGYSIEMYVFFNIDKHGRQGVPEGDNDCTSTKQCWYEGNFYGINKPKPDKGGDSYYDTYKLLDSSSYITSSTDFSLLVLQRGKEVDYTTYDVNHVKVIKNQIYETECFYEKLEPCEGAPFEEGIFGYHESVEKYPENEELFNSYKQLNNIDEDIFDEVVEKYKQLNWEDKMYSSTTETVKDIFKSNFSGLEFLDEDKTNFAGAPIRHFKFPSNEVSPFIYTNENMEFQETFIFPLGVTIDKTIINIFLDLAVKANLITQKQRDSISYFKIKRGDRTLEKSIITKGLFTDVIKYKDMDGERFFPNFPYNSLQRKELLSGNGYVLNHPYGGKYNNKFVFNSPEIDLGLLTTPTEINIDGFQYGTSENQVDQVKDHSKMVILSESAISTANMLASIESTFEVMTQVAELGIGAAQASSGGGFLGFSGLAAGAVAGGFVASVVALRAPMISNRTAELRNKWIEIFKNQGIGANFAHYISSVGIYNNFSNKINPNSKIRRVTKSVVLNNGIHNINEPVADGFMKINNIDREKSLFVYLGGEPTRDGLHYTNEFISIDNSNKEPDNVGLREIYTQSIANLYGALKVWKPDQYGQIGNIKWIDITGCNYLNEVGPGVFYGGDTFISKYAYKRKFNFFLVSDMLQANFTPFKYSRYFNIGKPKYYIDYETEAAKYGKSIITTPSSTVNLVPDTVVEQGNYITEGRFYHYQYGIPYFFVESTINCWNRYAGLTPDENFYPNAGDYMEWTQQSLVPIRKPNVFKYNYSYSISGLPKSGNFLPDNFVSKFYNCTNNSPNGIMYSSPDVSEKRKVDPWLVYKALDFNNFPTSNGKLINLINIESTQILGVFENKMSIFNAIDTLKERVSPETSELGTGGIFAQRPLDFHTTDLGYGGTQHKASVSCEFGHFWVDARRGQVFQTDPNGGNITEITTGLRNWFKEHLPFKLLKGKIEGLTDLDLDNPFKNLGIVMGYDSRFKRVFLTKLDYLVKPDYVGKLEFVFREGFEEQDVNLDFLPVNKYIRHKETKEEVEFTNPDIFEPVHFTLAYSPLFKSWISFYDFHPGFYLSFNNNFSTGANFETGPQVWSHLITNKSYGVFYGEKHPWMIEVPTRNQFVNKSLSNIEFWMDSLRYHNDFDYAINTKLGIDSAWVYNNTSNSGRLSLIPREINNRFQATKYPSVIPGGTQILSTYNEGKWSFNDFYDRVSKLNSNLPHWNYDKNSIHKTPNSKALSFNQRWQDRVKGDWFLIRLEGGSDTRFKQLFKGVVPQENILI